MRFFLLCLLLLTVVCSTSAQNTSCNGVRYKMPVFASFQRTTVPYATAINQLGQTITLSMDVYEPQGDTAKKRPVVVLAHGGSFIFGNKSDMARWCELLARRGYVAASIQYRLYPVFPLGFPDSTKIMDTAVKAVGDMKAAVRYFREDAATQNRFRADVEHIYVGGYSAGAVTALHTAFLDKDDDIPPFMQALIANNGGLEGNSGSPTNQQYSSAVGAVLNLSGGLYRRGWIRADEPPVASIHGTADATVPYTTGVAAGLAYLEGSGVLHPKALQAGTWSYLKTIPGGGHTNIYENAAYAQPLNDYWMRACALLEHLTCYQPDPEKTTNTETPAPSVGAWSIYPNPVSEGRIWVQLPAESPDSAFDLLLFDLQGREVSRARLNGPNTCETTIPDIPAGVYMALLRSASGVWGTQKIMRQ
ncbi:MAG: alpha/beta hydrolase fold domain-containing protein [Saprospiraceae bacterium]|nr:alpha/beta hydrolase fold domain-containing protein [Saprospiraceae bacterium]MDW8229169.1 alpha/beta hydrolase fold domain-containing protein [Saprospiraceae bacterium]